MNFEMVNNMSKLTTDIYYEFIKKISFIQFYSLILKIK